MAKTKKSRQPAKANKSKIINKNNVSENCETKEVCMLAIAHILRWFSQLVIFFIMSFFAVISTIGFKLMLFRTGFYVFERCKFFLFLFCHLEASFKLICNECPAHIFFIQFRWRSIFVKYAIKQYPDRITSRATNYCIKPKWNMWNVPNVKSGLNRSEITRISDLIIAIFITKL